MLPPPEAPAWVAILIFLQVLPAIVATIIYTSKQVKKGGYKDREEINDSSNRNRSGDIIDNSDSSSND